MALAEGLVRLWSEFQTPRIRGEGDLAALLDSQARLAAPLARGAITENPAKRAFDALPMHPDPRRRDAESFERSVRLLLVSAIERLGRRTDWEALARSLAAG